MVWFISCCYDRWLKLQSHFTNMIKFTSLFIIRHSSIKRCVTSFCSFQSLDMNASPDLSQWLVVSHHGIRLVLQPKDCAEVNIRIISKLGDVNKVTSSRTSNRPRWRCGDQSSIKDSQSTDYGKPSDYLKPPLSRSVSTVTYNLLTVNHAAGISQFYTEMVRFR